MTGPMIQVINRKDFRDHALVELPDDAQPKTLPPDSIRVRTDFFTISLNSFTYARLGSLPGFQWWDYHTIPENAPAPYNDTSKWGRIPCWGIGVVTESTSSIAPIGTKLYGYFPLGTQEVVKQVGPAEEGVTNQLIETSEYRKNYMGGFYNRYNIVPEDASEKDLAWDCVMKVLFETSYLIHRYAFTWDPEDHEPIFPTGKVGAPWTAEDASLKDAIVLIFAASSKTGAALVQQMTVNRPAEHKPRKSFAVGSQSSKAATEHFGWVDEVLLYSDDPVATLRQKAGLTKETRVVIFDYGGRDAAAFKWAKALKDESRDLTVIPVGSSPDSGGLISYDDLGVKAAVGNALGLRTGAMENMGAARYWDEFEQEWAKFKKNGGLPGIDFDISEGLEEMMKGWDGLAAGTIPGTKALLYRL